jgi:hypothetical protein
VSAGAGAYVFIMPESEVIAYWRKMKAIVETPPPTQPTPSTKKLIKAKVSCDHSNSIIGGKGRYCLDCEKYV